MDYKKAYAFLLGKIDDGLILLQEGKAAEAYKLLHEACLMAEEMYLEDTEERYEVIGKSEGSQGGIN